MQIIRAQADKFDTIKRITHKTISEIYPHYYPGGVVDFFLAHHNNENIMKDLLAGIVYLILDGEEAIGTVTIKENEICRLFVLPKYQHKGFGRQLLNFAERIIAEEYTEIYLDSSLPAKSTYLKRGYVSDYKDHPIKVLYENGVKVTINTDDLLLFDSSIENEYLLLYQTGALSAEQLNEVRKNGLGEAIG